MLKFLCSLKMKDFFDYIDCPVCLQNNYKILIKSKYKKNISKKELLKIFSSSSEIFLDQLVKCNNCNFIYLNPRINNIIIEKGYSFSEDKKFVSQNEMRINTFKGILNQIGKNILLKDKLILDVGSGGGAFLKACLDLGLKSRGIEPNEWLVNYARKNYQVDIKNNKFLRIRKKYDIITFFDVLEHVTELNLYIEKINSLLKKNGYLIINVPDHDSLARKILNKYWPFYLSVHLYYFTDESLKKLFGKKYKLVNKKSYWQKLKMGYIADRASKYFKVFKLIKKLLIFFNLDNKAINYNMGQSLFIFKKR